MGARRRFVAPPRSGIDPACFDSPLYAGFSEFGPWLDAEHCPDMEPLNAALGTIVHPVSGMALQFVEQTPALLSDGLHYEQRIHERGQIATRRDNWHDLFNALVWIRHQSIKAALNARQYHDLRHIGASERTRAQCALTHFDEAGAIVLLRDPALLPLWDAHDWHGLFWRECDAWSDGRSEVIIFGHALLEHGLQPNPLHSAKCIALVLDAEGGDTPPAASISQSVERTVAAAIRDAQLLNDPQELRPLPLSGIPGWHPRTDDESFYHSADCFRPLRPGRRYPAPLLLEG